MAEPQGTGDLRARELTPLRIAVSAGVLLALVVAALGLLPGSPLAVRTAVEWNESPELADTTPTGNPVVPATPTPSPTPSPELPPLAVHPTDVKIDAKGWWAWALQDTRTGEIRGSGNMGETNATASLIKAWIGADFLRRSAEAGRKPTDAQLHQVQIMIRDSDNEAATALYQTIGGSASIKRLISICKLTDSKANGGWSRTSLSPRDVTRLAACIDDGRAAGPTWTTWLLDEMRAVRGSGDFGIRKAFPSIVQKTIAIKNGWVQRTAEQEVNVNCLAIGDGWTMGVMTRYPIDLGYTHGFKICQQVAAQLRTD
ncbi:hypothetical protein BDK92_4077 [Micromonospora pisi]|uniref:Beta-lactamase family protein n=1 Tax=Micromonospora pisi TaxID=589240 RepID=A0A495JLK0_9ACTN|nr:serine hydrolase [Micromonospora pisi]RKR89721.1 hypothetical protein BDK92_4077 [Micromonospora pisi]